MAKMSYQEKTLFLLGYSKGTKAKLVAALLVFASNEKTHNVRFYIAHYGSFLLVGDVVPNPLVTFKCIGTNK